MKSNRKEDWQRFIPPELKTDASSLLLWLEERPFQQPDRCPYCASKSFKVRESRGCKLSYKCRLCWKSFTQTTGTPFARTRHPELWGIFAKYRFQGMSLKKIAAIIGITEYACRHRDLVIVAEMKESFPALFIWWETHQRRASYEMTPEAKAQYEQLQLWIKKVFTLSRAPCPGCGYSSRREGSNRDRPWFFCNPCRKGFSLLAQTPLKGMLYTELWPLFVEKMVSGESMWQLQHEYHINTGTLHRWRKCFLAMMCEMGLETLAEWTEWQRSREYSNALDRRKAGIKSPRPQKSHFNGRGQRKP